MKRFLILAAALAAVLAAFMPLPPTWAGPVAASKQTVLIWDAGAQVNTTALDCGMQHAVQCDGAPMRYRTCSTSTCVATSSDLVLAVAPTTHEILLPSGSGSCHRYFSFLQTGDAGTCIIVPVSPRTIPQYP